MISIVQGIWVMSAKRHQLVEFSYPIQVTPYVFSIYAPKLIDDGVADNWYKSISVFSVELWLVIIMTMGLLALFSLVCSAMYRQYLRPWTW